MACQSISNYDLIRDIGSLHVIKDPMKVIKKDELLYYYSFPSRNGIMMKITVKSPDKHTFKVLDIELTSEFLEGNVLYDNELN